MTEILHRKRGGSLKDLGIPLKHFVFGRFGRSGLEDVNGEVIIWTYHVAPIIKLGNGEGDGELYVLDPVLSSEPMLKHDYHKALESSKLTDPVTKKVITSQLTGFVTCKTNTVDTKQKCFHPEDPNVHPETDKSDKFNKFLRVFLTR